jgi:hypothetical protein
MNGDRRATTLGRMTGGFRRGPSFGEDEIEEGRQVRSGDEHGVVHAPKNSARRHGAAAGLEIGEDHAHTVFDHSAAKQVLDVLDAQLVHRDRDQLTAAPRDLLNGRYETGGELAVSGDDRSWRRRRGRRAGFARLAEGSARRRCVPAFVASGAR